MRSASLFLFAVLVAAAVVGCSDTPQVARGVEGGAGGAGATTAGGAAGDNPGGASTRELDEYYPVAAATVNAATPPMGWNSWNQFACNIDADLIRETADAMVASGMSEAGYEYINIDDCWLDRVRTSAGRLQVAPDFYPRGGEVTVDRMVVEACAPNGGGGAAGAGGAPASSGATGTPGEAGATGAVECGPTTFEAEAMTATGGAATLGGHTLQPNGALIASHAFAAGPARLILRGAGTQGTSTWPEVRVLLDDVQVGEVRFDSATTTDYTIDFVATAGTHTIELRAASGVEGLGELADYVHSLGLKLGVYGDRGTETCGHRAGSGGHEVEDAASFAAWGIDYLKYDNCAADAATIEADYRAMGEALPGNMVYSLCAWAFCEWGVEVGSLWRTTSDIRATWDSIYANTKINSPLAAYAGPGGWNDPDMLEVGVGNEMTAAEQQAHFSLWAIMAAPLIAGNDLTRMDPDELAILTNPEVIAVNQDLLGLQGVPVQYASNVWVWAKPLNESGTRAVLLLNATAAATEISFTLAEIGLGPGLATVRDLHERTDLEPIDDAFTANVPSHAALMLKVQGNEPAVPQGSLALSDMTPIYAANALGPMERDQSVGATRPGDGEPISIGGETYERGLGIAAPAKLIYRLGGNCSRFTATVGIDGLTAGRGSVVFRVLGDGEELAASPVMTATSAPEAIDVDVTELQRLEIRVTNAMDGNSWDRASLGDPMIVCAD